MSILTLGIGTFALAAAVWDVMTRRIPNPLCIIGCAGGTLLHGFADGWNGLFHAGAGVAAGFILSFVLYVFGAVGAGDVKWFAAAGTMAGVHDIMTILIISVLQCGLIGAVMYLVKPSFRNRLQYIAIVGIFVARAPSLNNFLAWRKASTVRFPFMVSAAAAVILVEANVVQWF
ncbi:A24 family peptidase [Paenibacillus alkalitolerans]|uniref:A24 family peptidase n=1 Tax=Paenibacillus alkalitolerans TaxID=2799335 RepID=UPI0018F58A90|nr:A24 family peptidase [Paenibacillus alkalitolerans]